VITDFCSVQHAGGIIGKGGANIKRLRSDVRTAQILLVFFCKVFVAYDTVAPLILEIFSDFRNI